MKAKERQQAYGVQTLSNNDLLTVITGREWSYETDDATIMPEWAKVRYNALNELIRRQPINAYKKMVSLHSSRDIYAGYKDLFWKLSEERFYILCLNRRNAVIACKQMSKGGKSGTVVDVGLICRELVLCNASACVVMHNHPSGTARPSSHDCQLTTKLNDALKLIDVKLLDHVIIPDQNQAEGVYYSFCDEGKI